MKLKDLRQIFSQYQAVDIYEGSKLLYFNDVFEFVPDELDSREVRDVTIINNRIDIYLEVVR